MAHGDPQIIEEMAPRFAGLDRCNNITTTKTTTTTITKTTTISTTTTPTAKVFVSNEPFNKATRKM